MFNVVIVNPTDLGKFPQEPNKVHFVKPRALAKFVEAHEGDGALMVILNTLTEIPAAPPENMIKITDEPRGIRVLKALVNQVFFSLGRYRMGLDAAGRAAAVAESRKEYEARTPGGHKPPANYVDWLRAQENAGV